MAASSAGGGPCLKAPDEEEILEAEVPEADPIVEEILAAETQAGAILADLTGVIPAVAVRTEAGSW
jgi:hypothetical protein